LAAAACNRFGKQAFAGAFCRSDFIFQRRFPDRLKTDVGHVALVIPISGDLTLGWRSRFLHYPGCVNVAGDNWTVLMLSDNRISDNQKVQADRKISEASQQALQLSLGCP
jgi:hypothetical protein